MKDPEKDDIEGLQRIKGGKSGHQRDRELHTKKNHSKYRSFEVNREIGIKKGE